MEARLRFGGAVSEKLTTRPTVPIHKSIVNPAACLPLAARGRDQWETRRNGVSDEENGMTAQRRRAAKCCQAIVGGPALRPRPRSAEASSKTNTRTLKRVREINWRE